MTGSSWRRGRTETGPILSTFACVAAPGLALLLYSRVAWPWSLLGWVLVVPWMAALDRRRSLLATLAVAVAIALVYTAAVFPWLPAMTADYSGIGIATAWLVFVVCAPLIEPQLVAFAVARYWARPLGWCGMALVGAGAYVGAEWALPKPMGDTLGQGQLPALAGQAAELFGTRGVTFLLLVASAAVLELARRLDSLARGGSRKEESWRRLAAPLLAVVAAVVGASAYGAARLARIEAGAANAAPLLRVAAVQSDLSHYDRLRQEVGSFDAVALILETHFALSARALGEREIDLLLWPETVYPTTFWRPKSEEGAAFDRAIAAFVQRQNVPLVLGAYDAENGREYNAAFLLEPVARGGIEIDVYRKTRLFPLTEYLPALLDVDWLRRRMPWAGTWKPGDGARVLTLTADGDPVRVAPLICYDAIDPDLAIDAVREGAEVLLTLSNDSWFDYPGARELILAVSAFRSIETRRPQVRATPTGVTAFIDATGSRVETLAANQPGVLVATVLPARGAPTLMVRLGDWLPPTAGIAAALALLAAGLRRGRAAGST